MNSQNVSEEANGNEVTTNRHVICRERKTGNMNNMSSNWINLLREKLEYLIII